MSLSLALGDGSRFGHRFEVNQLIFLTLVSLGLGNLCCVLRIARSLTGLGWTGSTQLAIEIQAADLWFHNRFDGHGEPFKFVMIRK